MREKKVVRPFISSLEKRKVGTPCRGIVEQDKVNTIRTRQIGPKRYVSAKEDAGGNESRKEHESLKKHRGRSISVLFIVIFPLKVLFVAWKIFDFPSYETRVNF